MRVAMLSDAHLDGPNDPNQARLLAFLHRLEADRLCLLGDIFQRWWHFGAAPFPAYAPVVEALRRFEIWFVPGNHDFHAARFFEAELGARAGSCLESEFDGLRVQLTHGDVVDTSVGYRAVTALLRGRPFAALVDALGPARAWRFLGALAGTPGGAPDPALVAAQRSLAEVWLAARRDVLSEGRPPRLHVMGHTHAPGLHVLPGGWHVNLGDWVRWHTWLLVDDGRPTLLRDMNGVDRPFAPDGPPEATGAA